MISSDLNRSLANRYGGPGASQMVKEAFDRTEVSKALGSAVGGAFETDCAIVFSDVSGFAKRVSGYSADQIRSFLQTYYAKIIPIIYRHGGLIDQMMGDGIISVFSTRLSPTIKGSVFDVGLAAAEEVVKTFAGDADYSTKCAMHSETAVICDVGDNNYRQSTVVGNALTAVYRVEAEARDESVNMLYSMPEAVELLKMVQAADEVRRREGITTPPTWVLSTFNIQLKGIAAGTSTILVQTYNR